jgi:hypothetical protein
MASPVLSTIMETLSPGFTAFRTRPSCTLKFVGVVVSLEPTVPLNLTLIFPDASIRYLDEGSSMWVGGSPFYGTGYYFGRAGSRRDVPVPF